MTDTVFIVLGLAGLWLGTNLVIRAAIAVSLHYRLSETFVGLAILSIGSDIPELAVAIDAGIHTLRGEQLSGITVGTSIGSAFGQIGLVLGVAGLAGTMTASRRFVFRNGAVLLGSIVILALTALDGTVTRLEGLFLVGCFMLYLTWLIVGTRQEDGIVETSEHSTLALWASMAAGMVILVVASEMTVSGASALAATLGISQAMIAILIIGPGTSLPELAISIGAIVARKPGMSVGNVVGSNIFDTFVPVGVAAVIAGIQFDAGLVEFDLVALFLLSLLVLVFFARSGRLARGEAAIILCCYLLYISKTIWL